MEIISELVTVIASLTNRYDREIARRAINRSLKECGVHTPVKAVDTGTDKVFHLSGQDLSEKATGATVTDRVQELLDEHDLTPAPTPAPKAKAKATKAKGRKKVTTDPEWGVAFQTAFDAAPAGKQRQTGKRAWALVKYHGFDVDAAVETALHQITNGLPIGR